MFFPSMTTFSQLGVCKFCFLSLNAVKMDKIKLKKEN